MIDSLAEGERVYARGYHGTRENRMSMLQRSTPDETGALARLLTNYSIEVTSRDVRALDEVARILPRGMEVFVSHLPADGASMLLGATARLRAAGLCPVPHIVARNILGRRDLAQLLEGLSLMTGVEKALVLGGDREQPAGAFECALQIIESGLLEENGIRHVAIACHPEGHLKIPDEVLGAALKAKIAVAERAGLKVSLISQFAFDPAPIIAFATALRESGIIAPLFIGVAGPASRTKLIRYAIRCGIGASLKALRDRGEIARNMLSGEFPDNLLGRIALAQAAAPSLGIAGIHFFTFGDPAGSVLWAEERR